MDLELMTIVLDLTDDQIAEIEPILDEHQDKMDDLRAEGMKRMRRTARKNRVHRNSGYDKVERREMRAQMREKMREHREKMAEAREKGREDLDEKLAGVLDDGQMKKLVELRELREARREMHRELREERRELRGERGERSGGRRGRAH
jgi:hypothetical protein